MANDPSRKYFSDDSLLVADRAPESGQNVGGDRRDFERDEDQNQFDRRRHQAHADGAEQDQAVIFAGADLLHLHVLVGSQDQHDARSRATST